MIEMRNNLQLLIKENSQDAYTEIYNEFADELYLHALKRVKDADVAEDILQELFIEFWDRRSSLDITLDLRKYLFGAIKFKIIDHFNKLKSKSENMNSLAEHLQRHAQQNPDHLNTYIALEKIVDSELQKMSSNMREILLMRWEKYSIQYIAKKLNLSEQTVKNNFTEANKRLKKKLLDNDNQLDISLIISFISIFLMNR
ncbi:RNA polymerase sigma factor [Sphingobacterium daejeonense]|uniref:RNA polymerase sigma factor n=1 Tax=Sphingobacterium daejeonense TaxID=371142 RepID=UPI003D30F722